MDAHHTVYRAKIALPLEKPAAFAGKTAAFSHSDAGDLHLAVPTEFRGPGGGLSPEDLFLSSLGSCMIFTLTAVMQAMRLDGFYKTATVDAYGPMEPHPETKKLRFAHVNIDFALKLDDETKKSAEATADFVAKFPKIIEKVKANCFIHNSVACEVVVNMTAE